MRQGHAWLICVCRGLAALATLALPLSAGKADDVAEFYRGKEVKVIVGGESDGGYAPYGRLLQRFLGQYIPGNPSVIVQFMPGAGGLIASNHIYNVATGDSTVIGGVQRSLVRLALFGDKGVRYDPSKINWIGSLHQDVSVCVAWHTADVKTIQDAMQRKLIIGAISPNNDTGQFPELLNTILGTKFEIVYGYKGTGGISLAMQRGEIAGRCGWSWDSLKGQQGSWIEGKQINVLTQMTLRKHPELAGVPLAIDIADTKEKREILEFIFAEQVIGRPFIMAPNVPKDRVEAIRKAFMQVATSEIAVSQMRAGGLDLLPINGVEMDRIVDKMIATPKQIVERARSVMQGAGK